MTTPEFPDLVNLKDAARMAGKSERTIRRWMTEGTLTDLRPPGNRTSPVQIRTAELRTHLATLTAPVVASETPAGDRRPDMPGGDADTAAALVRSMEARITDLHNRIDDLVRERDQWRGEARRLTAELQEATAARSAVERELAGKPSVKGLLRSLWAR